MHEQHRLAALSQDVLKRLLRGIERESLRITPDGALAATPHPRQLGSALTHPHITTDFSESQLELITGVCPDVDSCVQELAEIHQFVYRHLDDEMLWSSSMPCRLPADDDIPLGQYGSFQCGKAQDGVPNGPFTALRPPDANHLGRALQLFAARGGDGDAAAGGIGCSRSERISVPTPTSG